MKRFASLLLALAILFSLAVPTFADGADTSTITIKAGNGVTSLAGRSFAAYKLLDAEETYGYEEAADGTYYKHADGTYSTTRPEGADDTTTKYNRVPRYVYTVASEWKTFFTSKDFAKDGESAKFTGNEPDFNAQVVAYIQGLAVGEANPNNSGNLFAFAQNALDWANKQNPKIAATGTIIKNTDDNKAEFNALPMGYYLIADTTLSDEETSDTTLNKGEAVSALMLGTTDVTVTIKSEVTTVDKNIIDGGESVKYTNGAIGDCVEFKITTKVPDMLGYQEYTFTIHDTMSKGLTFDEKTACTTCQLGNGAAAYSHAVKVTVGTGESAATLTELTDGQTSTSKDVYTMSETSNEDGTTKITIDFPYIFEAGWTTGDPINVTYYALIDENAAFISTGIPNEVKVEYSNDPTDLGDGGTDNPKHPTGETPPSRVEVFYGEINLKKVDESNKSLAGAIFELKGEALNQSWVTDYYFEEDTNGTHWKLTDGTYTTTDPDTEGIDKTKYESTETKYSLAKTSHLVTADTTDTTITAEVAPDGTLKFQGLKAGEYVITEIKSPAGYNMLKKPIYVKLDVAVTGDQKDYNASWSLYEAKYDADGDPEKGENNAIVYATNAVNNLTITVVNQAGAELPETGGMGTTLFYIVGAGLMLAAIVLLVAKKRAAN